MTPRVSIITPYRNATCHLAEAIASVQAQSIHDWELLLIDDQSEDNSVTVASGFAERDRRIRMLATTSSERSGAAAARNVGLAEAQGELVAFLDADDLFLPDALETGLVLAEANPRAELICGAARWWYPDGGGVDWVDQVSRIRPGLHEPPDLLEQIILFQRDQVPCTCAVLARRAAVVAVGGFEESLSLYEDQSLWAKLFARSPAFLGTHLTSLYRQHPGSASAKAELAGDYHRLRVHPARRSFLDWMERDLAGEVPSRTVGALRIARAMLDRNGAALTVADRPRYLKLLAERGVRRGRGKFRALGRRLMRRASTLPQFTR
jgi:hypothetical protein